MSEKEGECARDSMSIEVQLVASGISNSIGKYVNAIGKLQILSQTHSTSLARIGRTKVFNSNFHAQFCTGMH